MEAMVVATHLIAASAKVISQMQHNICENIRFHALSGPVRAPNGCL